jgi:hypothetical protein
MSLIDELNRRHVFKVAAAYAVVAWVLIQVASAISRPMSLPEWFETVLITFLILGFPIALLLAWAFDLNPAANPASDRSASSSDVARQRNVVSTILAITALGAVGASGWWVAGADERRARSDGIAELDEFIASGDWEDAYQSAVELKNVIPGDSELAASSRTGGRNFPGALRWNPVLPAPASIAGRIAVQTIGKCSVPRLSSTSRFPLGFRCFAPNSRAMIRCCRSSGDICILPKR